MEIASGDSGDCVGVGADVGGIGGVECLLLASVADVNQRLAYWKGREWFANIGCMLPQFALLSVHGYK